MNQQGLLPWRVQEFYGTAAARVRVAEATAGPRLRGRQHRLLLGHPGALRGRRPRAAARRGELRRQAHQPARRALAVGVGSVRAAPRGPHGGASDARARGESARLHVRRAAGEQPPQPTCSSPTRRPPRAASSTTKSISRRSASGTLPVLERRVNESITGVAAVIIGAWERPVDRPCPRSARELRAAFVVQTHNGRVSRAHRPRPLRTLFRARGRRGDPAPAQGQGVFARMSARFQRPAPRGRA